MLHTLSAATSALDLLKSLTAAKSPSAANRQEPKSPFDLSGSAGSSANSPASLPGVGGGSQISPATMSALLAAQSKANEGSSASVAAGRSDALKDMFAQIDADSDGKLSQAEFENALGAGGTNLAQADRVFGKLDKDGDGSVSPEEMMSALKGKAHRRDDDTDATAARSGRRKDPSSAETQATISNSVTNSDGSVTTSLTYADGSKVTITSAAMASSSAATSSYNFIERMIQQQTQAVSSASAASLSISA